MFTEIIIARVTATADGIIGTLQFKSASNTSRDTNSGGAVIEACGDGAHMYTLIHENGKYIVLDGAAASGISDKEFTNFAADMTVSGSQIYYAAINGSNLLFCQNGTFIDDKTAQTAVLN